MNTIMLNKHWSLLYLVDWPDVSTYFMDFTAENCIVLNMCIVQNLKSQYKLFGKGKFEM